MSRRAGFRWWTKLIAFSMALAFLAAIGFAAWEWPSLRAKREVRRALAAGRYRDAWMIADQWIRDRPRSAEAHYLRAKAAIALGRKRDISAGLKEAQARGYPEERLAVLRALLDAQYGRTREARPILARAFAESHEPDPMLDEALARVYMETYDYPHAGAVLDRWAADAPDDARPPLWHAAVHRRSNAEPEVIIDDYREALRRDTDNAEARRGLAEQLEQAHRNREAADAYAAYLALRPDDPAGHLGAGRNAADSGDDDAGQVHLDRVLDLDPENAVAHLERAKISLRRGANETALVHLDRAVALAPFDPVAHYQRSLALKRLGRRTEAEVANRTFTRLQEDRRELNELQEDLALSPQDPRLQSRIARWMFGHGYDAEAVQWARKILTDTPGHPETCLLLANYYDRLGQPEQAKVYRQQVKTAR